jgi:hypothetical protein
MTWTYDVSDLATSARDQVRFMIGDTLPSDPQMQDEEIDFALTQRSTLFGVSAICCRALATKYSRSADQQAGDTKVAYSQIAKAYTLKAIELESQVAMGGGVMPFAGGLTVSDVMSRAQNADLMPSQFNIGMMDSILPVPSVGNETQQETAPDTQQR